MYFNVTINWAFRKKWWKHQNLNFIVPLVRLLSSTRGVICVCYGKQQEELEPKTCTIYHVSRIQCTYLWNKFCQFYFVK